LDGTNKRILGISLLRNQHLGEINEKYCTVLQENTEIFFSFPILFFTEDIGHGLYRFELEFGRAYELGTIDFYKDAAFNPSDGSKDIKPKAGSEKYQTNVISLHKHNNTLLITHGHNDNLLKGLQGRQ